MDWNLREDLPIYSQIIDRIKVSMANGELKPGQKLPAVREIALDAKVNPNTMQRAFSELEREGLVFSQRTSGRFVTEDPSVIDQVRESLAKEKVDGFISSMKKLNMTKKQVIELIEQYKEEE